MMMRRERNDPLVSHEIISGGPGDASIQLKPRGVTTVRCCCCCSDLSWRSSINLSLAWLSLEQEKKRNKKLLGEEKFT